MPLPCPSATTARQRSSAIRDILHHARRPDVISLAGGIPDPSTFPLALLADAADRALSDGTDSLQYGLTAGEAAHREVFAAWTGTDPVPSDDQVVVTTGSQQGIALVTGAFVDPGDTVVVAEADYLGALQVFRTHQASIHTVPVDAAGLDVGHLAADLADGVRPKLVYTVPNHHNPTGATLTADRAAELADLADHYGFLIVEDDPYRELTPVGCTPVTIGPGSPNVVRLRSVSKVLAPGLRLGWMVAPRGVTDLVTVAKQSLDLHTSTLSQSIAAHVLADPRFPAHLDEVRHHYDRQRRALIAAVRDHLPELVFSEPGGGMFLWASGTGVDTAELLPRAVAAGVAYVPGSVFDPRDRPSDRLRLSYATASPTDLQRATATLAELLAEGGPAPHATRPTLRAPTDVP